MNGNGKPALDNTKWKVEPYTCARCSHKAVAVHPDCERIECGNCGYMVQSAPCERDFDADLEEPNGGKQWLTARCHYSHAKKRS